VLAAATAMLAIDPDNHDPRKEERMEQAMWFLQVLSALAALMRLLHTGRRNGWI